MGRILVGGISPEGEVLLRSYLDAYMPDAEVEPLKATGIRGKMKIQASRPDVMLVILDTTLYSTCVGYCDDVLSLPKVHKYVDDNGLKQFLISKFGKLEINTGTIPPDRLMGLSESPDIDLGDAESISSAKEDNVDLSSEVADLKDKLAQSELLVRNLTLQLEEANDNNDLSDFVKRIKNLEAELDEKNKQLAENTGSDISEEDLQKLVKAEEVLDKYEKVVEELRIIKENTADSDFKYNQLKEETDTLRGTVSDLNELKAKLEEEKAQLESVNEAKDKSIDNLSTKLDDASAQLDDITAKLEGANAELELLHNSVSSSGKVADGLNSELEHARNELDSLKVQLSEKDDQVNSLKGELESKDSELNELRGTLDTANSEKDSLSEKISSLDEERNELNLRINSLTDEVNSLNSDLNDKVARIDELTSQVSDLSESDSKSEDDISKLNEQVGLLKIELSGREMEVKSLKDDIVLLKDDLEVKNSALDSALSEKNEALEKILEYDNKLSDKEEELRVKTDELSKLSQNLEDVQNDLNIANSSLEEKENSLNEEKSKYQSLEEERDSLNNKIEDLEKALSDSSADKTSIDRLESELLEEKRKVTRLSSEMDVLKKAGDFSRVAELRSEISSLKEENKRLKKAGVSQEKYDSVSSDLSKCRSRLSSLESDLAEKIDLISELNESIFNKMSYVSAPKLACDIDLSVSIDLSGNNKFYCFASGSLESNNSVYKEIRKAVSENKDKRFLIVDLVTDSLIDKELGVQQVNSPINWLNGTANFKDFIASTKYNNVKCLSTGFSFLNDLYLLQVDWEKRLSELVNFGDVIIFNIGCLNNTVTKILYNTFSSLMQTNVIVKATPINLRTLILSMTGLKKSDKSMIYCVGYDEALSKPMYQRLTQKYKATVLSDKDILKL